MTFEPLNRAYRSVFTPGQLTVGLVVPIEAYPNSSYSSMTDHVKRVQLAEQMGFGAVWLRDVPFNVPYFGDAGQVFDPFVYLGLLAGATSTIGLGVASIILPLRHPAHVAKAAATADVLSDGRLLLGIASGDRPAEYPAMAVPFHERGERFRESVDYISRVWAETPNFSGPFGEVGGGMDLGPKPVAGRVPMLLTGSSQQDPSWIADHGDGWMTYPRDPATQQRLIDDYRGRIAEAGGPDKPVMQPLYIDLTDEPMPGGPRPIHLGMRLNVDHLVRYLNDVRSLGVNHVALNLRFNEAGTETTLERIADTVLPEFPLRANTP